jgi:ATP phosphoribosyltransferase
MQRRMRVATKYPLVTADYFARLGRQVEIIKLYGSMELAPVVGMADVIVDITETGSTLKANGLVVLDDIVDISSRLIVNKASMKMKHETIHALMNAVKRAVTEKG